MIWSISWKNVWRNKTRSMVVIVAVTLGLFSGVFAGALMVGMVAQKVVTAVDNEVSHIQIHHPDYFANKEVKYTIDDYEKIKNFAENNPAIKAISPRTKIIAMANTSGSSGVGIMLYGIYPGKEKEVTKIYKHIQKNGGNYFEIKNKKVPPVVISDKTAKKLKLVRYQLSSDSFEFLDENGISTKVIQKLRGLEGVMFRKESKFKMALKDSLAKDLSVTELLLIPQSALKYKLRAKIIVNFQGYKGGLVQSAFRVVGVYKTDNTMFDEMSMFVLKDDLDRLAGMNPNMAHEVAILCNDIDNSTVVASQLKSEFENLSILEWSDIQPELKMFSEFLGMYFYIMTIFILLALGFGIVNTMLMAILERIKELGMLMAVGMNKLRVFSMIMLESVFLTLTGGVLGIALSTVVVMLLSNTGIDFRALYGEGFGDIGYSAIIYPELNVENSIGTTMLVILTGILASIYPARKAIKLNPADAVRTDN